MEYDIDSLRKRVSLFTTSDLDDELIEEYINHALSIAELECSCKYVPKRIQYIVVDTVVECIERRGHEGFSNRSELSTTTSYFFKDLEDSLKSKLKGKKNPNRLIGIL